MTAHQANETGSIYVAGIEEIRGRYDRRVFTPDVQIP